VLVQEMVSLRLSCVEVSKRQTGERKHKDIYEYIKKE
jgi:hypothetical protein